MEANLVPGMSQGSSYFPKACEIENEFTYDKVIELMLSKGLNRIPYVLQATINSPVNHNDILPALQPILVPLNHQELLLHEGA